MQQAEVNQKVGKKKGGHKGAFRAFLSKAKTALGRLWHKVRPFVGYPLIYLGVMLMVVFYFTDLTNYNLLLFLPLVFIVAGIIGNVASYK